MSSDVTTKRCTKCGNEYPLTDDFWIKRKDRPCGYHAWCKRCKREASKQWKTDNPEKSRIGAVRRYHANPENKRAIARRSYWKNPEAHRISSSLSQKRRLTFVLEYLKRWRQRNPDKIRAYRQTSWKKHALKFSERSRIYRQRHPEIYRNAKTRRRALEFSAEGSFTEAEITILFRDQEAYCFHCGCDLIPIGFHRDHWIPLSRGGSNWISNIRLLCPRCNLSKSDKLPCEWDNRYCD